MSAIEGDFGENSLLDQSGFGMPEIPQIPQQYEGGFDVVAAAGVNANGDDGNQEGTVAAVNINILPTLPALPPLPQAPPEEEEQEQEQEQEHEQGQEQEQEQPGGDMPQTLVKNEEIRDEEMQDEGDDDGALDPEIDAEADPQQPPTEGAPPDDAEGNVQVKDETPRPPPHRLAKAYRTTLQLKTDLSKSSRDSHPCGVLHFARASERGAEEHAFAWIARHEDPSHLEAALSHMEGFGFGREGVAFVPYSSRRNWIERYPLAFPHVHCGEHGQVTGFPYWSADSGLAGGRMTAVSSCFPSANGDGLADIPNAPVEAKRGRKKKKIVPTAHLPNEERDELHVEMYKYLRWLNASLGGAENPLSENGGKRRSVGSAAGINASALQNLLEGMELTFKVVRNARPAIDAAAAANPDPASALPFLEESLAEPLGKLVDVAKKDPEARSLRAKPRKGHDFEDMYERLLRFQQEHGHVNVAQKYAMDGQLGSWVANIRSKRKQMAKRGEEFELDVPLNEDEDVAGDDGDVAGDDGDGRAGEGSSRKRKRGGNGRQRLTRERIHRLDTVGFQWVVANPNTKSWEERFEDLKEYQQMHGTTRVPRSSGTLGEWVHMQRRLYNKKDPNFLKRKAALLEDIGFEWHPRKHALVSWEDNFNRLMEFGRINRHYNVQSPFPEGYLGDHEQEQDSELLEAHRFHKWVRRIHAEYRAYASGKGSRMLNDARVMQLREIGFQFAM